jgi:FkbM family methyltransferase
MITRYDLRILRYIFPIGISLSIIYLFYVDVLPIDFSLFQQRSVPNDGRIDLSIITNESFQCVKSKLLFNQYRTTICVHDARRDTDVSGLIVNQGIWEENFVRRFVYILSNHRQLAFIDIGANIGTYTMYAASLGCSNVISIECFLPNVERIRRAIQIENVQKQVILIPRALYSKSNVYLSLRTNIANNIGSQRLNAEVSENKNDSLVVRTMRFDDLLSIVKERNIQEAVIKIDIETSEHYLCETGKQMFNKINIPFVMMEWANIKGIPARANLIKEFFTNLGYIPFNSETCQPETETNYQQWKTQDIYWIKQNYAHLCKSP